MFGNIVKDVKKASDLMVMQGITQPQGFMSTAYNAAILKRLVSGTARFSEDNVKIYVGELTQALIDEHRKFKPDSKEGGSVKKVLDRFNEIDVEKLRFSASALLSKAERWGELNNSAKQVNKDTDSPKTGAPIQNGAQIEKNEVATAIEKEVDLFKGLFMCLGSALRMSSEKPDFRWYLVSLVDKNVDKLNYFKKVK